MRINEKRLSWLSLNQDVTLDEIDVKILHELVKNARKKLKDIAQDVGISPVAVFKRIEHLKANGVITEATIFKDAALLGHPCAALIGVNLEGDKDAIITELCKGGMNLAGISPSVGKYDLCIFAIAKSLLELDQIRRHIKGEKGVKRVAVNIWTQPHFNFDNFRLKPAGE
jgi:Lrp/AsnC family transcriptional regulator for asnA, asnC and gidA